MFPLFTLSHLAPNSSGTTKVKQNLLQEETHAHKINTLPNGLLTVKQLPYTE